MSQIDTEAVTDCVRRAVADTLADIAELPVKDFHAQEDPQPVQTEGVTVILGVTGDLEGSFTLNIQDATAIRYTAHILGMEIESYDEVVASAIGELGNMVVAQTTMNFQRYGIDCDLTPPTIVRSAAAEFANPQAKLISMRFGTDWGTIVARIFLRSKEG